MITETWPLTDAMATQAAATGAALPQLRTARTVLCAPSLVDFTAYRAIACSERGQYMGGPMTQPEAWDDFCRMVATWVLRGHGVWSVKGVEGTTLGFVLVGLEPGDLEPELGFLFLACHEGRGLAHEAASAARDHAFGVLGLTTLVSYIDPANSRAQSLAARLGAVQEGRADGSNVWRYTHGGAK